MNTKFLYACYNNKLFNKACEIYNNINKNAENCEMYIYDWKNSNGKKCNAYIVNEDTIDYFWITFKENNIDYKISLFYKDIDTRTGNIHVIPGKIQVHIKSLCDVTCNSYKKHNKGCLPLIEKIDNDVWCGLATDDCTSKQIIKKYNIQRIEDELYINEVFASSLQLVDRESLKNGETILKKCSGKANEKHYDLIKYYIFRLKQATNEKNPKRLLITAHKIFFDINGNPYSKYGETQIQLIEKGMLGSNRYDKENGWQFSYPDMLSNESKVRQGFCFDKIDNAMEAFNQS